MPKNKISAQKVLRAQMRVRRRGKYRVMSDLEQCEPDLAEYMLENLTEFYHQLLKLGAPARQSHSLYQQIESLVLICVTAARPE